MNASATGHKATATSPAAPSRPPSGGDTALRRRFQVSAYDRAASWLVTLLIMSAAAVVALFVIWLTSRMYVPNVSVPIQMENVGGSEDGSLGDGQELDAPDDELLAEQTDLAEPELQETVTMLSDALAEQLANLDDPLLNAELESGSRKGSGAGDSAPLGGGGDGEGGFPRAQRWRIQFDNTTLEAYARQLDAFGIELAAIQPGRVEYAQGFVGGRPQRRTAGEGTQENRLYMSWQGGTLQQFDMQLLQAAGISPRGKLIVQFYPEQVENRLAELERAFANRAANQIRRTTFGIRIAGGRADFYVISQDPL